VGRAGEGGRVCSVGMLKGLYLWTFDAYGNFNGNFVPVAIMQGLRFNGDGTTYNTFGTVNIGGTTISTPPERQEPIRSHRTARAPYQSPTARALICTSDRVHRSFGSPRLREALAAARELVLELRHVCQGGKSSSATATRFDLSPIIGFGAFHPRQTRLLV